MYVSVTVVIGLGMLKHSHAFVSFDGSAFGSGFGAYATVLMLVLLETVS